MTKKEEKRKRERAFSEAVSTLEAKVDPQDKILPWEKPEPPRKPYGWTDEGWEYWGKLRTAMRKRDWKTFKEVGREWRAT